MSTLEATPTTAALNQTMTFQESPARVYDAWTNPSLLGLWLGPANMTCSAVDLDVRPGGDYRIEMRGILDPAKAAMPFEANTYSSATTGNYRQVIPNRLIEFTWTPAWTPGEESLITVIFKEVAEGTEMAFTHERFSAESLPGYTQGWKGAFAKLAGVLETA
jgi:uncharacterized protein YndB with AHSA1/START domain